MAGAMDPLAQPTVTVSCEDVLVLARLGGIEIPPEDLMEVRAVLAGHLGAIAVLDELDLTDVEPVVHFDPRWR
jgi:Asp-tRNA(Asn)/Glu-tRNA(Gln) amidotransferase C subunit